MTDRHRRGNGWVGADLSTAQGANGTLCVLPRLEESLDLRPTEHGSGLVGRDRELDELRVAMDQAARGHGRLVLIGGEPGIGKSRLADELATQAREAGHVVLWGRGWEDAGAPPYWPWVQILRSYIRGAELDSVK